MISPLLDEIEDMLPEGVRRPSLAINHLTKKAEQELKLLQEVLP